MSVSAHDGISKKVSFQVMDNLLVQVCGKKKAVLFSPNDFEYLYIQGKL